MKTRVSLKYFVSYCRKIPRVENNKENAMLILSTVRETTSTQGIFIFTEPMFA